MTVSVTISVATGEPRAANGRVEQQMGSGKDAFWSPSEVFSINPGEAKVIPLYPQRRIVLEE